MIIHRPVKCFCCVLANFLVHIPLFIFSLISPGFMLVDASGASPNSTNETKETRVYRTPEERREAGNRYELFKGFNVSALAEFEHESFWVETFESGSNPRKDNSNLILQGAVEYSPTKWLTAEMVYEYDTELDEHIIDEALIGIEVDDFSVEAGRLYVPFGEFISSFVTGPGTELGETRYNSAVASYTFDDLVEIEAFIYQGRAKKWGEGGEHLDWGWSTKIIPTESATIGVSYLSDLADSLAGLLADEEWHYEKKVDAVSGFVEYLGDRIVASAEVLTALRTFNELDAEVNKPFTWNIELGAYPVPGLLAVVRVEGNDEIEDEPELRTGIGLTWRPYNKLSVSVEYLRGEFKEGLAEDDEERAVGKEDLFVSQLVLEF